MSCLEGSLRTTGKSRAPQGVFGRSEGEGGNAGEGSGSQKYRALPPPLGIIEVIHAASRGISWSSRRVVLSVVSSPKADNEGRLEKKLKRAITPITFSETDLEGTSQPHDDTLVVLVVSWLRE